MYLYSCVWYSKHQRTKVPTRATLSCMCENVAFRWFVKVTAAMKHREKLRFARDDKSS